MRGREEREGGREGGRRKREGNEVTPSFWANLVTCRLPLA